MEGKEYNIKVSFNNKHIVVKWRDYIMNEGEKVLVNGVKCV